MTQPLPDFALTDQFGREVRRETYAGTPLIVVVGNRQGAKGVALWTSALRDVVGAAPTPQVLATADLGNVPRLLRGAVRRLLPRDPAHWCAIDWKGDLAPHIRGDHEPLVAATFGADGLLRTLVALPLDDVVSATLVQLIEAARDHAT